MRDLKELLKLVEDKQKEMRIADEVHADSEVDDPSYYPKALGFCRGILSVVRIELDIISGRDE